MKMDMFMYWTCKCEFIFESWKTTDEDHFLFVMGCFLSAIYAILHIFLTMNGEKKYKQWEINLIMSHRLYKSIYTFFASLSSIIVMMLMMTMSGWVNLALAIGLTIGYVIQITFIEKQKKRLVPII